MISVAIIHAPQSAERAENVRALTAVLPRATVVTDAGHAVAERYRRRGCWPIARRAWQLASERHHLVLEDDAGPCDDFMAHVEALVAQKPNACISLFRGARDCSVATIIPRHVIPRWLRWVDTSPNGSRHLPHHDYLITQGMRELGVERLYAEPSLIEHLPLASLLDHEHVAATRFEKSPTRVELRSLG